MEIALPQPGHKFTVDEYHRLTGRAVIVHRDPGSGGHETLSRVRGAETVNPVALPALAVSADQILG
jgi:hypothetical protein